MVLGCVKRRVDWVRQKQPQVRLEVETQSFRLVTSNCNQWLGRTQQTSPMRILMRKKTKHLLFSGVIPFWTRCGPHCKVIKLSLNCMSPISLILIVMTIDDNITQYCDFGFDLQLEKDCGFSFDLQLERDRGVVEPSSQADLDGAHPQEDLVSKQIDV